MKQSRVIVFALASALIMWAGSLQAGRQDIPIDRVPKDVIAVLNQYLKILTTSPTLEVCGERVAKIAAGHMLSRSGGISSDVMRFSLKKDYQNAKFYRAPIVITRVVKIENDYDGYGPTLFQGTRYRIWIAKKEGVAGLPAPIPIIKPASGAPKIVTTIGSL
ncbi:MAG: hypothetical protein JW807_16890 [Spirochaetes bacterium]|nr:hypothetical protein [Spirochaetota bacterium]